MYYHHLHQRRYSNIGCGIFRKRVRAYVQCGISFGAFFPMYILGDHDTYLPIWMTWFYLPLEHLCCQNMIKLPNESYTNCDQNPPMALHKKLPYVFCFKSNFSWCILMSNPIPGPLDWKNIAGNQAPQGIIDLVIRLAKNVASFASQLNFKEPKKTLYSWHLQIQPAQQLKE